MKKLSMSPYLVAIGLIVAPSQAQEGRTAQGDTRRAPPNQDQHNQSKREARLQIQPEHEPLIPKESCTFVLSVTNLSSAPVSVQSSFPERDYQFDLRDEHGESVPMSEASRKQLEDGAVYKNVGIKLGPRDHFEEKADLCDMYNLSSPGNYTVRVKCRVWREDGSGFEITSRLLRFRVAAPASK